MIFFRREARRFTAFLVKTKPLDSFFSFALP